MTDAWDTVSPERRRNRATLGTRVGPPVLQTARSTISFSGITAFSKRPSISRKTYHRQPRAKIRGRVEYIVVNHEAALRRCLATWPVLICPGPVSYTHLRAHETVLDLVCRLLLEKNK